MTTLDQLKRNLKDLAVICIGLICSALIMAALYIISLIIF